MVEDVYSTVRKIFAGRGENYLRSIAYKMLALLRAENLKELEILTNDLLLKNVSEESSKLLDIRERYSNDKERLLKFYYKFEAGLISAISEKGGE